CASVQRTPPCTNPCGPWCSSRRTRRTVARPSPLVSNSEPTTASKYMRASGSEERQEAARDAVSARRHAEGHGAAPEPAPPARRVVALEAEARVVAARPLEVVDQRPVE